MTKSAKKSVAKKVPAKVETPVHASKKPAVDKKPVESKESKKAVSKVVKAVLPQQSTEVFSNGKLFGFTVSKTNDPVLGHESEFGIGNGVAAHCVSQESVTYKIL